LEALYGHLLISSEANLLAYKDQIGQLPESEEDDYDHHLFLHNVRLRKYYQKVIVEGANLGASSLPVYDALAVNHQHVDWAQKTMATVWTDVANGVGTKLKVD
jgi:hypothetical protein|tara:strand:- start:1667 stop:1975 length:309 start_codon:yes stop_codon:yes gene_type:complete